MGSQMRWVGGILVACVGLPVLGRAPAPAQAETIYGSFTGVIDAVDSALAGTFTVGDPISGTYTYDSTAANIGTPVQAVYNALLSLDIDIGGYLASSTGAPEIQVDNEDPFVSINDRYAVISRASDGLTGAAVGGHALDFFGFRVDDSTNTVFSDASLPTSVSLSDFDSSAFFLFFGGNTGGPFLVSGHLTSLSTVPEPGCLVSMLSGLAAFGAFWTIRRRK